MRRRFVALGATLVLLSCGTKTTTRVRDFNEYGDPERSYSTETTLFVGKDRAAFEAAKAKEREGDYGTAIEILEELRREPSLEAKLRQDVLLGLGEMYGAWMNAFKEYDKGMARLHQLLTEFPDTPHRLRAEELLQEYDRRQDDK